MLRIFESIIHMENNANAKIIGYRLSSPFFHNDLTCAFT